MRTRARRYTRNGLAAFALLTLACWVVPSFFNAERYRRRLEAGLERALDRPVTFGAVSYRLLPRPGFSIENATVREDPAFGSEPFARVERIDCDLRWRSLWHTRLDIARLYLERPSLNLVRNARGEWNVESFLRKNGLASPGKRSDGTARALENLDVTADDARVDFIVNADKKPFSLIEVNARVNFDRQRGMLSFRLEGSPIRTDLSLPSPGLVQLEGQWTPGTDLEGPLDAVLRTQGALFYDWVPLITSRNPQIYGILDAKIQLAGSLHKIKFDGQSSVSQLHRSDQVPSSDPMLTTLFFRGEFDRTRGRVMIESLDGTFADSRIHLTGSIGNIPSSPRLDLAVAVERSRLEDFLALGRRLSGHSNLIVVTGRVNALLTIQGPWKDQHYSGFVSARGAHLTTPSGDFPISDLDVRIENGETRLAPVRILMAPRAELIVEGAIDRAAPPKPDGRHASKNTKTIENGPARYEVSLTAKSMPLHDLLNFGRAVGILPVQGLDARGSASGTFTLSGSAWPLERPVVAGLADLNSSSLLVPGMTEPINLPRVHIQVAGSRITADPVVAVLGTSVFTGSIAHQGDRAQPWEFDVRANTLNLEQGSLWFDALGRRQPIPLLERLPGLSSFGARRAAASDLFGALDARGHFSSPTVTYRSLSLDDFNTSVEISGRIIRLVGATFRATGGRGQGQVNVNLMSAPARVSLDVTMTDGNLKSLAGYMPDELRKVRGIYSGAGHFETRGLSHEEMTTNLQGSATVRVKNVLLGDFDPLQAVARQTGWGTIEPARGEMGIKGSTLVIGVQNRRVVFGNSPVELGGAKLKVNGVYSFDGAFNLNVRADLRHIKRRWLNTGVESEQGARTIDIRMDGSLGKLVVVPEIAAARSSSGRRVR